MEKDHKICLVLKDLPVGGVEEVFFSLAQELVVNNYDVNLVILKNEYSLEMLNRFKVDLLFGLFRLFFSFFVFLQNTFFC